MENPTSSTSNFRAFFFKFLFPSVLIIGVFAVTFDYLFVKKIIFNSSSSGAYKIYRNKNLNLKSEIPIFGSSRAAGSYVPDLLDTNCYNYGIEKTEHRLIEIFLKNELSKNKTTPIIINFDYEIWVDWIGDLSNYIPNLEDSEINTLFNKHDSWYYHIKGIRFYGFYQYYFKQYKGSKSKKNVVNKGGFFLKEKTPMAELKKNIEMRKKNPIQYSPSKKLEDDFLKLLSQNNGRKIFIVIAPYHHTFMENLNGKDLADIYIEKMKKLNGVYVFDYSGVSYPDSLFKDTGHLNFIGAQKFCKELKVKLHENATPYFN